MAASIATVGLTVQWTPPAAAVSSGNSSFSTQLQYQAQNVGNIDVPTTAAPATVFAIPMGSVDQAKCIIIRNALSADVGVRLNGAVADNFRLASGAEWALVSPTAPTGAPLGLVTSVSIVTTATPLSIEQVFFFIFGD